MTARYAFPVMGTMASVAVAQEDVRVLGQEVVDRAVADARAELDRVEQVFSHYRSDSDITRWANGEVLDDASRVEIELVLAECAHLTALSDGDFLIVDPRTGELDTAGYVKGYGIENAVAVLRDAGLSDFALGVGGDAYFAGEITPGQAWRVAVQDPRDSGSVVAVLEARDCAVATSGRAERGDHVWSRPGSDRSDLLSATVVGPSVALADAFATVAFAKGARGLDWIGQQQDYRCLIMQADGSTLSTAALVSAA